ncbi:MAG: NUDIX domain-containing protein [Bacteroidales bacterium]|nr:NUDIX domain-containing protein [Bacteroidales bacterium]
MQIYFGDRTLTLATDIEKGMPVGGYDAIHKYSNQNELRQFLRSFDAKEELKSGCVYYHDIERLLEHVKECYKYIQAAGGLVENEKGEYLVIERLGKIDLPKGKQEQGETPEQNALREVNEETGLSGLALGNMICDTYHTYPLKGEMALKRTRWFEMTVAGVPELKPQTEENIVSAKWIAVGELRGLVKESYPSLQEVFKAAL